MKKLNLIGVFIILMVCFMPNVFAASISDNFKTMLNEDGKFHVKSVPPKNIEDAYFILGELSFIDVHTYEPIYDTSVGFFDLDVDSCNDKYTKCSLKMYDGTHKLIEEHEVEIVYDYDEDILSKLKDFIDNFPDGLEEFEVRDMELINYWMNAYLDDDHLDSYSGELQSYLDYSNIDFYVSNRAGDDTEFYHLRRGIATFSYEGVIYYMNNFLGTKANNIIYVPDDTADKDVLKTVQARIDEYVGEGKLTVKEGGEVAPWLDNYAEDIFNTMSQWDPSMAAMTFAEWKLTSDYEDAISNAVFLKEAAGGKYYTVKCNNITYKFVVIKDSSKMVNPTNKTKDLETSVLVSTESNIPLDTKVKANELTSGEEYDKVMSKIETEESDTYDITLYSNTLGDNITKLEDGKFEVTIPVSEKLEGKELTVYYVDADGNVTTYDVTVKEGLATFITDHFSIYTLASVTSVNPNTGDNIIAGLALLAISVLGVIGCSLYLNKQMD